MIAVLCMYTEAVDLFYILAVKIITSDEQPRWVDSAAAAASVFDLELCCEVRAA